MYIGDHYLVAGLARRRVTCRIVGFCNGVEKWTFVALKLPDGSLLHIRSLRKNIFSL
jgi:hypothetical protein